MEAGFWHERWRRDEIGFHRSAIHPLLETHWRRISAASRAPVLVPLCGKSLDLTWLAVQGHQVVGVELSDQAARDYFSERGVTPRPTDFGGLPALTDERVTVCIGDFFTFEPTERFALFYDRAAMIALPGQRRRDYRSALREILANDARGLLITLDYPQERMDGPPFSVGPDELEQDSSFEYKVIEERDALPEHPGFGQRGLDRLVERAIRVEASRSR